MRVPLQFDRQHDRLSGSQEPERRQEIPAGDDARAAARLQPDLHRLRPHSRVQVHDQRDADRRGVPEGRRRVRRADRFHLRRRTDDLSRNRSAGERNPGAQEAHLPLHERHVHSQAPARVQADFALFLQRAPGRARENARYLRRARRRVPRSHRRHQGGEGGRLPGDVEHDDLQGNRHRRDRRAFCVSADARRGRPHALAGLFVRGGDDQGNLHVARRNSREIPAGQPACSSATTS